MSHTNRRRVSHRCQCLTCQQRPDGPTAEAHRAIIRFLATTDERSRRLLAGAPAVQQGRGGTAGGGRITGLSPTQSGGNLVSGKFGVREGKLLSVPFSGGYPRREGSSREEDASVERVFDGARA